MSFARESDPAADGVVPRRFVLQVPAAEVLSELERWATGDSGRSCTVVDSGPKTVVVELSWRRSDATSGRELARLLPRFLVQDGELHAVTTFTPSS